MFLTATKLSNKSNEICNYSFCEMNGKCYDIHDYFLKLRNNLHWSLSNHLKTILKGT